MARKRRRDLASEYARAKMKHKPGHGGRFKALAKSVDSKKLAAWIGHKKYGRKKMARWAAAGRKH